MKTRTTILLILAAAAICMATTLNAQAVLYEYTGGPGNELGSSVSRAGDVDMDGREDVIIGEYLADLGFRSNAGSVTVKSGATGAQLYRFYGNDAYDWFGRSVSGAGDVDNDGHADLIVGAPRDDDTGQDAGSARVLSGLDGTVLYTFYGNAAFDRFGWSVSGAGDVNQDDYDDVIVGAIYSDCAGFNCGQARVFSGFDGAVLYTFNGALSGAQFGWAVAGAGDVDDDGYADVVVGANLDSTTEFWAGSATVYSGLTGLPLYTFYGDDAGDQLGSAVSTAGDINDDGHADVILGVPLDDPIGYDSGSARVISGIDGTVLFSVDGIFAGDEFGRSVGAAGDADGDGVFDVIVGAPYEDFGFKNDAGAARVISGHGWPLHAIRGVADNDYVGYSVDGAGDINMDGYDDVIVGAPHATVGSYGSAGRAWIVDIEFPRIHARFEFIGNQNDFTGESISATGDVNGDGYDDIAVGSPQYDGVGNNSGRVQVFSGINGSQLHEFEGVESNDQFGRSVAIDGDVNGDGLADIIVGALGASVAGSVFVYSGADGTELHRFDGTGVDGEVIGSVVASAGDVNGDGRADILTSASGYDHDADTDAGLVRVYSGFDGSVLHEYYGDDPDDKLGLAVSGFGDVNADGYDDFGAGTWEDDDVASRSGLARIYSGFDGAILYTFRGDFSSDTLGRELAPAGDYDADGHDDMFIGVPGRSGNTGIARIYSGFDGTILRTFTGDNTNDTFGKAIAVAGDVDDDGVLDYLVGAPGSNIPIIQAGFVRLFSGFDGSTLLELRGDSHTGQLGNDVSGPCDVDRDGAPELVISERGEDRVHVYIAPMSTTPGYAYTHGAPCVGGANRLPRIGFRGFSKINTTPQVTLRSAAFNSPATTLFLGFATALPLDLLGLTGCNLFVNSFLEVPIGTDAQGTASVNVPIPNDPGMLGLGFEFQWLVPDAAAPHGLPLALSDALSIVIGD